MASAGVSNRYGIRMVTDQHHVACISIHYSFKTIRFHRTVVVGNRKAIVVVGVYHRDIFIISFGKLYSKITIVFLHGKLHIYRKYLFFAFVWRKTDGGSAGV